MTDKRLKRPRAPVQLGKLMGDILTGQVEDRAATTPEDPNKNQAAVTLGRKGGLKGGRPRAESLTSEQRTKIAENAAKARWGPQGPQGPGSSVTYWNRSDVRSIREAGGI